MKAQVEYFHGWRLILPKQGNAPMLFLEWMCSFRAGKNWIHKISQPMEGEFFNIRLNMTEAQAKECAEYINANS